VVIHIDIFLLPATIDCNNIQKLRQSLDEYFPVIKNFISNRNKLWYKQPILWGFKRLLYSLLRKPLIPPRLLHHLFNWNRKGPLFVFLAVILGDQHSVAVADISHASFRQYQESTRNMSLMMPSYEPWLESHLMFIRRKKECKRSSIYKQRGQAE
jgi:hypothetical protein